MKKSFIVLIISLFLFFFTITASIAANQDIIINEIGASEPSGYEWIEIYNRGSQPVDLNGWKFTEDFSDTNPNGTNHNLNFSNNSILNSDQCAIIAQDQNKFKEKYPSFSGLLIDSSWGSLNESGEKIGLRDANSNIIESFTYLEAKNYSLERIDANSNDYTNTNWKEHANSNTIGTPNSTLQNSSSIITNQNTNSDQNQQTSENIIINTSTTSPQSQTPSLIANAGENMIALIGQEITFDASKSQGDISSFEWNLGDGQTAKEKVIKHKYDFPGKYIAVLTVLNSQATSQSQIAVTIHPSGVYINEFFPSPANQDAQEWIEIHNSNNFPVNLTDWKISDNSKTKSFILPKNTFITPQSYLVLTKQTTKLSLNNDSDSLKFFYPGDIPIEEISYNKATKGQSASKNQNGDFIWSQTPTPGQPNIFTNETPLNQQSSINNRQEVSARDANSYKSIIQNNSKIVTADFVSRNLINIAKAQVVEENIATDSNASQELNDEKMTDTDPSANIYKYSTNRHLFAKIFLILATMGIFALMWQTMKRK